MLYYIETAFNKKGVYKMKKGSIILTNKEELYIDIDYKKYINNIEFNDDRLKNILINNCMVIFDKKTNEMYYVLKRVENKLDVMKVITTNELLRNFMLLRNGNGIYDYVKTDSYYSIDVTDDLEFMYYTEYDDFRKINKLYKLLKKQKVRNIKDIELSFGDIICLKNKKTKYIFIKKSNDKIYVCNMDSLDFFTGIEKIDLKDVKEKYGTITIRDKENLTLNINKLNNDNGSSLVKTL